MKTPPFPPPSHKKENPMYRNKVLKKIYNVLEGEYYMSYMLWFKVVFCLKFYTPVYFLLYFVSDYMVVHIRQRKLKRKWFENLQTKSNVSVSFDVWSALLLIVIIPVL